MAEHLLPWFLPALRPYWFSLGVYGILVFFLVSGYIIPTSLERHGDVRAFWISRFFRLYPLYLAVIALVLALAWWVPVRGEVPRDGSAVAAHATMLLDVVSVGGVADTMWTLSYEMVFYLLVTALFLIRGHDRSGLLSMGVRGGGRGGGAGGVGRGAQGRVAGVRVVRGVRRRPGRGAPGQAPYAVGLRARPHGGDVAGAEQPGAVAGHGGAGRDVRGHGDPPVGARDGPVVAGRGHHGARCDLAPVGDRERLVVGAGRRVDHHDRAGRGHVRDRDGAARPAAATGAGVVRPDQLLALPGAPPGAEVLRGDLRRPAAGGPAGPARPVGAGGGRDRRRQRADLPVRRAAHAGAGPPRVTPVPSRAPGRRRSAGGAPGPRTRQGPRPSGTPGA
ncbi:acyltransferase [Nonomuraea rubra]|uniref:acyltransferase family protein n=1 Tax=Nonomuraea rubra TaxID=46180 RepID=UPI0031EE0B11